MNWLRRKNSDSHHHFLSGDDLADDPFATLEARPHEKRLDQVTPYILAGLVLVAGVGFLSQYLGQDAAARGSMPTAWEDIGKIPRTVVAKSSLMRTNVSDPDKAGFPLVGDQASSRSSKSDFIITLASLPNPEDRLSPAETLIFSPPIAKLEQRYRDAQVEKRKILNARKERAAEESCLAVAIYFEARSESELGQKAIAKVIMNRVKNPAFPKTICGVVYQNANKGSNCQFSFACDGNPDQPKPGLAWETAKRVAADAMAGDFWINEIKGATHYHADYVNPRWSGMLKRLGKIGRHIFYTKG
ncbi:cell wall hydrolase [Rhodoligotrophos defluvii]|uniref:cell wall hydrolase n=1 Tax=Rhodoligotrophos defluvii TaxID=2561934 RepID=UPI0010CA1AA9|nr:cell wall hydrolase [Rhodoligotrophos defluvii]